MNKYEIIFTSLKKENEEYDDKRWFFSLYESVIVEANSAEEAINDYENTHNYVFVVRCREYRYTPIEILQKRITQLKHNREDNKENNSEEYTKGYMDALMSLMNAYDLDDYDENDDYFWWNDEKQYEGVCPKCGNKLIIGEHIKEHLIKKYGYIVCPNGCEEIIENWNECKDEDFDDEDYDDVN